jgi:2-aminoadipate transaminase
MPPVNTLFASRTEALRPSAIREILKATGRPDMISFAGGLPAPELFPVDAVSAAVERMLGEQGQAALQYDVSEGHLPLREWVADHVRETVGLAADPDDILITHGSQQALDLIAKALLNPGDTILVENPSYLGALQVFRAYEANIEGVEMDAAGLVPAALGDRLGRPGPRPKFLYLIPNFQNPTGATLAPGRRAEIARIAAAHGVAVIEDDPYGQLRYAGPFPPCLAASADAGPHDTSTISPVYLGTASKLLAPGLRVAWAIVRHPELRRRLIALKQAADLHTSGFTQRVVHALVRDRHWLGAHVARLRAAYASRLAAMDAALAAHLPPGTEWTKPQGGMFVWAHLPPSLSARDLLQRCAEAGVLFVPGDSFWVGAAPHNTLRLNFSHASEERIATGLALVGRCCHSLVKTAGVSRPDR